MTLAYPLDDHRTEVPAAGITELMDRVGVRMTYARNEEIYGQGDDVEFLYRVVSGSVRTIRLTSDGRRQVGDFYYPGDLFGLETGPDHRFSAEALTDCIVLVVKRSSVRAAAGDAALDRAILSATHRELDRAQSHLLLLGRKTAQEKVAAFLLSLAERVPDESVELAMGRQDMADYLGLTIETVSRMLSQLQAASVVEFPAARRFRVCKWERLEELAD
ncbi:helix-turn-helix domain-containing protein [Phenylobacterium sp.]|uniref:helix-turn-helix domain-containing protein n=1 Tax=Phenylobacterium sp. TaxID=1871053 RepID=UPI002C6F9C05|nr:helix-turn-helix domain-containing protein [Phenylobacterium sp.]HVI33544.1 helix-turn-helix domain-containing protein [Phenylobacterium sp.]